MSRFRLTLPIAVLLTGLYVVVWRSLAFVLPGEDLVDTLGWWGLYAVGVVCGVVLVEHAAQGIEAKNARVGGRGRPAISISGEVPDDREGGWNPLDPAARYYGRTSQRLRQTFTLLAAYSLLFMLVYMLAHMKFGSDEETVFDLPPGGGNDSPQAMSVKVQKVIRKKYVINPYSSIVFAAPPPIENIDVKLTEDTANRYQVGQGDGGLGEGDGEGGGFGSGKGSGKIRFIRMQHSDRNWNKNFNFEGDRNLLTEFVVRFPRMKDKAAEDSEAMDFVALGNHKATAAPAFVYIGGTATFAPTAADKRILKQYLTERHGMILGDCLGNGGFNGNFVAVMDEITGTKAVDIPRDDDIHKRPFEVPQLPIVVAHAGTTARGWKIDGRWAVYYHPGALSDAWRDDRAGIKKPIADQCYQLGINIINYAYKEANKWRLSQKP